MFSTVLGLFHRLVQDPDSPKARFWSLLPILTWLSVLPISLSAVLPGRPEGCMKNLPAVALAASLIVGGLNCSAQGPSVPFLQIERDAQSQTLPTLALNNDATGLSSSFAPVASSVSRDVTSRSRVSSRTLNKTYFFVNGLHLGMAVLDVTSTEHCIANHTCREGNPLMPSSAAGQVGVDCALVGYISWVSYRMKKHQSSLWWIAPTTGTAAHAVGAGTGIAHF